jgi:UDP-glucuronate 4-epimerase
MKILVTGTAGFIGFHLTNLLLTEGHTIIGLDSINDYYDVKLKEDRLKFAGLNINEISYNKLIVSQSNKNYQFIKLNLEDKTNINQLFEEHKFDIVVNLAAQAGVRYSITNPQAYIDSNITGFFNILEACRHNNVKNLLYASSSSVYGLNKKIPFSVDDKNDTPISLYAATKKSNELMAHTYSHLFGLQTIGLRFFTVYGPWGRPDMALYMFTKSIIEGKKVEVFNNGDMSRDFTYVSDIVNGINGIIKKIEEGFYSNKPYKVYNIGNSKPVKLLDFISEIEANVGKQAIKEFCPMQPGDVQRTFADVTDLTNDTQYAPSTDIKVGVKNFVNWYKEYYKK